VEQNGVTEGPRVQWMSVREKLRVAGMHVRVACRRGSREVGPRELSGGLSPLVNCKERKGKVSTSREAALYNEGCAMPTTEALCAAARGCSATRPRSALASVGSAGKRHPRRPVPPGLSSYAPSTSAIHTTSMWLTCRRGGIRRLRTFAIVRSRPSIAVRSRR
jgi:hypothetical protein